LGAAEVIWAEGSLRGRRHLLSSPAQRPRAPCATQNGLPLLCGVVALRAFANPDEMPPLFLGRQAIKVVLPGQEQITWSERAAEALVDRRDVQPSALHQLNGFPERFRHSSSLEADLPTLRVIAARRFVFLVFLKVCFLVLVFGLRGVRQRKRPVSQRRPNRAPASSKASFEV
jgi:hypothetical protein